MSENIRYTETLVAIAGPFSKKRNQANVKEERKDILQKSIIIESKVISATGFYSSLLTGVFTFIALAIGVCTPPVTGAFCKSGCLEYPFKEVVTRFPRDYLWMYPAMLFVASYVVMFTSIHYYTTQRKKILSHIALIFSIIAGVLLIGNYFVQVSVIQPSLIKGETVGIALLTQYNEHGVFIALEDIGYFIMSLSFLFAGLAFDNDKRIEKSIRWIFIMGFILTVFSFGLISMKLGIMRGYIFEVAVISITWIALIANSILMTVLFWKEMKCHKSINMS